MEKRCCGCMQLKTESPLCEHCGYNENIDNFTHQLPVGTMLQDRYEIGKVLGQGGFGITYIGWDHKQETAVAIKEFYPRSLVNRDNSRGCQVDTLGEDIRELYDKGKARFLKEANTLARLSDIPEIVHIYNFFEENNTAYMVMEHLKGADLRKYIRMKGGKISLEKTLTVMRPIMSALHRVHQENMVHRDISPDNIMLLPGGTIKLLDFGAAREVLNADPNKNLSHSTETILKHGFAPIEQYQSSGTLGPWTDIYALTATIYYCLTGTVPPEAHKRLLDGEALHWDTVPGLKPSQIQVLDQAMALMPAERIRSVKELEDRLYEGISQRPRREETDFRTENDGQPEDGMRHSGVSTVDDWKFTSGGGIAQKTGTGKQQKPAAGKQEKTGKKSRKGLVLAAIAAVLAAVLAVGVLLPAFGGTEEKLVSADFEHTPDRTIRYEDGTRVDVFLNDRQLETGRLIRDADMEVRYQFTAVYDENGNLTQQKVYGRDGTVLRTDEYIYNDQGLLIGGESIAADGSCIRKAEAVFTDGKLIQLREERGDGSVVEWTYSDKKNIEKAVHQDAAGNIAEIMYYTEFLHFPSDQKQGPFDPFAASLMEARGGYGASPMGTWVDQPSGGGFAPEKPKKPIAVAITEPEETWEEETAPAETEGAMTPAPVQNGEAAEGDVNDGDLWVNSHREKRNGQGNPLASYVTRYDDSCLATGETCTDRFGEVLYESEFVYSGSELIGEDRTAPDGTRTEIRYLRDICGNRIATWTTTGGETEYEEYDPAESIVR